MFLGFEKKRGKTDGGFGAFVSLFFRLMRHGSRGGGFGNACALII